MKSLILINTGNKETYYCSQNHSSTGIKTLRVFELQKLIYEDFMRIVLAKLALVF